MYEIPDEIVAAAQRADYEWSRTRKPDGRQWGSVPDDQARRLIAGAVAAERERIRLLARKSGAMHLVSCDCPDHDHRRPFADLIDGERF